LGGPQVGDLLDRSWKRGIRGKQQRKAPTTAWGKKNGLGRIRGPEILAKEGKQQRGKNASEGEPTQTF